MADGGCTTTGLNELRSAVDKLPAAVETAARRVAGDTAFRVAARARGLVPYGPTPRAKGGTHTRDSIVVIPHIDRKEFRVEVGTGVEPPMLPIWLEFGTRFMAARPFMRPSVDAERDRYKSDLEASVEKAAKETLG